MFYQCFCFLTRLLFRIWCRVHLVILESPPTQGPFILASNHISHFEPVLLSSFFPRSIDWVAMEELFCNRLNTWFFKKLHVISVDRLGKKTVANSRSLRLILKRLKSGRVVGIFPEGGIRLAEESILQGAPIKPGVTLLSLLSEAPIIPCVILGTDRLYLLKNWLRRPHLWIIIGKAIQAPDLPRNENHPQKNTHHHSHFEQNEKKLRSAFLELQQDLCDRFALTPEDLPKTAQERRKA